jgi:hypothetical protein
MSEDLGASGSASVGISGSASVGAIPSVVGSVSSADKAFCSTFTDLKNTGDVITAANAKDKLKALAKQLRSTAPSDIKDDADTLADFYDAIVDASTGSVPTIPSESANFALAAEHIAIWTETHCGTS